MSTWRQQLGLGFPPEIVILSRRKRNVFPFLFLLRKETYTGESAPGLYPL